MSSLIFKSLEIKGFRVFEHLQIERLGRVNLIVGKNNVGKSSLLEALMVYAHQGSPQNIWQLLESRDEIQRYSSLEPEREIEEALAIKHLFHGRSDIGQQDSTILIGELDSPESQLSIAAGWYRLDSNTNGRSTLYPLDATAEHQIDNLIVGMTIQKGTQKATIHRFAKRVMPHSLFIQASKQKEIDSLFIPVNDCEIAKRRTRPNLDTIFIKETGGVTPLLGKAEIHTWLAWQKEPGKPLGQAITARYLNPNAPDAQQLIAWIRRVFHLTAKDD